MMIFDLLER
jgi:hypothetical protein